MKSQFVYLKSGIERNSNRGDIPWNCGSNLTPTKTKTDEFIFYTVAVPMIKLSLLPSRIPILVPGFCATFWLENRVENFTLWHHKSCDGFSSSSWCRKIPFNKRGMKNAIRSKKWNGESLSSQKRGRMWKSVGFLIPKNNNRKITIRSYGTWEDGPLNGLFQWKSRVLLLLFLHKRIN